MGCWKGSGTSFWGGPGIKGLDEEHDNYRNGYRPRRLNFFGLGAVELKVPRDRQGSLNRPGCRSARLRIPRPKPSLAEAFLAGLSTRDLARISEKHLGQRYDSKQVSRIVGRATTELEAWRQRPLGEVGYKFLYVDGANFRVRITWVVSRQSFCAVLGVSEQNQCFEVLVLEMGDREGVDLWENVFTSLVQVSQLRPWSWASWMDCQVGSGL
jgi:putative transposase